MGGGALLAWPTTASSPQIIMEIHISNWTHKFQNKTGLDGKANSELYKSNQVCSVVKLKKHCPVPNVLGDTRLVEETVPVPNGL